MDDTYTPASLYEGLIGAVLVVAGILGFFYSSSGLIIGSACQSAGADSSSGWDSLETTDSSTYG